MVTWAQAKALNLAAGRTGPSAHLKLARPCNLRCCSMAARLVCTRWPCRACSPRWCSCVHLPPAPTASLSSGGGGSLHVGLVRLDGLSEDPGWEEGASTLVNGGASPAPLLFHRGGASRAAPPGPPPPGLSSVFPCVAWVARVGAWSSLRCALFHMLLAYGQVKTGATHEQHVLISPEPQHVLLVSRARRHVHLEFMTEHAPHTKVTTQYNITLSTGNQDRHQSSYQLRSASRREGHMARPPYPHWRHPTD